jgi:hypothetical protein
LTPVDRFRRHPHSPVVAGRQLAPDDTAVLPRAPDFGADRHLLEVSAIGAAAPASTNAGAGANARVRGVLFMVGAVEP